MSNLFLTQLKNVWKRHLGVDFDNAKQARSKLNNFRRMNDINNKVLLKRLPQGDLKHILSLECPTSGQSSGQPVRGLQTHEVKSLMKKLRLTNEIEEHSVCAVCSKREQCHLRDQVPEKANATISDLLEVMDAFGGLAAMHQARQSAPPDGEQKDASAGSVDDAQAGSKKGLLRDDANDAKTVNYHSRYWVSMLKVLDSTNAVVEDLTQNSGIESRKFINQYLEEKTVRELQNKEMMKQRSVQKQMEARQQNKNRGEGDENGEEDGAPGEGRGDDAFGGSKRRQSQYTRDDGRRSADNRYSDNRPPYADSKKTFTDAQKDRYQMRQRDQYQSRNSDAFDGEDGDRWQSRDRQRSQTSDRPYSRDQGQRRASYREDGDSGAQNSYNNQTRAYDQRRRDSYRTYDDNRQTYGEDGRRSQTRDYDQQRRPSYRDNDDRRAYDSNDRDDRRTRRQYQDGGRNERDFGDARGQRRGGDGEQESYVKADRTRERSYRRDQDQTGGGDRQYERKRDRDENASGKSADFSRFMKESDVDARRVDFRQQDNGAQTQKSQKQGAKQPKIKVYEEQVSAAGDAARDGPESGKGKINRNDGEGESAQEIGGRRAQKRSTFKVASMVEPENYVKGVQSKDILGMTSASVREGDGDDGDRNGDAQRASAGRAVNKKKSFSFSKSAAKEEGDAQQDQTTQKPEGS